ITVGVSGRAHGADPPSSLERLVQHNGFHAVGAGGNHVDGDIAHFRNTFEIATGIQRQFVVFSDSCRGFSPTRQLFKYRLSFHDGVSAIGKNVEELAAIAVSDANLERLDAIKNVQLGDTQPVDAVDHNGALHGCAVKPTAAAR